MSSGPRGRAPHPRSACLYLLLPVASRGPGSSALSFKVGTRAVGNAAFPGPELRPFDS